MNTNSLVYVRILPVIAIILLALTPLRDWRWREVRAPAMLIGATAAIMLLQLIPLPPQMWQALPGHAQFSGTEIGIRPGWRTLSLTPDLGWNSFFALGPALVVLIGFAGIDDRGRTWGLLAVIGSLVAGSAILGVVQITGGDEGPAYFYAQSHFGSSPGLFANRNHQAVLLAMGFPLLSVWSLMPLATPAAARFRALLAVGGGIFLIMMILITGSRAGLGLGLVAIILSFVVAPVGIPRHWRSWFFVGVVVVVAVVVLAVVLLGRDVAATRAFDVSAYDSENRFRWIPILLRIGWDFFPTGAGFGAFDRVFRSYEPDALLKPTYVNHAHNELLEIFITAGLPGLVVLVLWLVWVTGHAHRAFRWEAVFSLQNACARLGSVMTLLLVLSSLVDYPLRTPLMTAICAVACCWIANIPRQRGERTGATLRVVGRQ